VSHFERIRKPRVGLVRPARLFARGGYRGGEVVVAE
jgi:hypothetical protein